MRICLIDTKTFLINIKNKTKASFKIYISIYNNRYMEQLIQNQSFLKQISYSDIQILQINIYK